MTMLSANEISPDPMEGVITEHGMTKKAKPTTRPQDEALLHDIQSLVKPSDTVHIEHNIVESDEDDDLCLVEITEENRQKEIRTAGGGKKEKESEGEDFSAFSPNNSGDSDDDRSDIESEVGDVDLDDILEVERVIEVDEEDIVAQYERGTFGGSLHHHIVQTNTSPATNTESHFQPPPGLEISRPPRPLHFFDTADHEDDEEVTASIFEVPQIPKINGMEVRMTEVDLTDGEIEFYSDAIYGRWRAGSLSRLRRCWMPIEALSFWGKLDH